MAYDVVIRNGFVVDGSGLPRVRADVGIRGGRISRVGRIRDQGTEEIDAEGHVVTPGFVDGHTHMDAQVFWDPYATPSSYHGVTTMVMGHCGFTLAPVRADARELVVRNLERAEDMPAESLAAGIKWSWESFPEYMDAVDQLPKAVNYAANIGHSALRTWAMGERAFEGAASDDDLDVMEGELLRSLEAGALGFTTSRGAHETSDDRPVASRLATWDEVRRLVIAMGNTGTGIFQLAAERAGRSDDPAERDEWFGRLRDLAVDSGVLTSLPVAALSEVAGPYLGLIERVSQEGGRMFGLSHSRGVSVLFSFETRLPFDDLPHWREVRALPFEEQRRQLRDPAVRERLIKSAHESEYGRAIGAEVRAPDYDLVQVWQRPVPPNPTIAELAQQRNVDPVELMIDLALETDLAQLYFQPIRPYTYDMLLDVMKHPRTVMAFSDAGAHVSQVVDCSIQTHLLAYWTRDREEFTLEEAVRMITMVPATLWGFADRGLVREGFVADLNVFDPETIGPDMPVVAHDFPAGARRFVQRAHGIKATLVNGEVILRDGEHTGALPGALLRGPLAR